MIARRVFGTALGRRLPIDRGEIRVRGCEGPVTLGRDRWGFVYVDAKSEVDGWFGVGFALGQDRSFQLEQLVRVARGTLSALIGPKGVPVDRLSRRLGFYRLASRQIDRVDPEGRAVLEAYARGIEEGRRAGVGRKAHELSLLGAKATPFEAADSIAIAKLLAYLMASNWEAELVRLEILRSDGVDALAAVDPPYPSWLPVSSPPGRRAGETMSRLREEAAALQAVVGEGGGSNNWAIAPRRTRTHRPIVANDPHLAPMLPAPWYVASISAPGCRLAGAGFVGLPGIWAGHNGFGAWGVTNGFADTSDCFLEEIGADRKSIVVDGALVGCELHREVIRVRGRRAVEELVLVTPHGPVVGPAVAGDLESVALRATWLDDVPVRLPRLGGVRSIDEFRAQFSDFPLGSFNFVYADRSGTIGWQLVGSVPRRPGGASALPRDGADSSAAWSGETIRHDELPGATNPKAGFVATANNRPLAEDLDPDLGNDWMDGYRLARLVEVLSKGKSWDPDAAWALQEDLECLPWRELRDVVLSHEGEGEDARRAVEILAEWDGRLDAGSRGGLVWEVFLNAAIRRFVRARVPSTASRALGEGIDPLVPRSIFAFRRASQIVGHLRSEAEDRSDLLEHALAEAGKAAVDRRAPAGWGERRKLWLRHPVGRIPGLGRLFDRGPYPLGGDTNTVAQAAVDPANPFADPSFIPNLRMVVDVGAFDEMRIVLAGGQSGNPCSPHYDDLLESWRRGEGQRLPFSDEARAEAVVRTLTLAPENS